METVNSANVDKHKMLCQMLKAAWVTIAVPQANLPLRSVIFPKQGLHITQIKLKTGISN